MTTSQPLSQQAAFLCRADSFQRFVERRLHRLYDSMGANEVAEWLREYLGVQSRAELDVEGGAREKFLGLLSEYNRRGVREYASRCAGTS
jgi:hypothetical protein